jgi:predicted AAA+ superfamily ATPase
MPHKRKRHFVLIFNKILTFSPITGCFGHRQVGKSTFLEENVDQYFTLDSQEDKELIAKNPEQFIKRRRKIPVAIDECQSIPELFPALKNHILKNKRPGQFILSGSVRFTSHKSTRESLAGRMTQIEILPFSAAEVESLSLPDTMLKISSSKIFDQNTLSHLSPYSSRQHKAWENYLDRGGLPGLLFIREEKLRSAALMSLLYLMLDRDLRLVISTKHSIETLLIFLKLIAKLTLTDFNFSEIKRKTGLSTKTQKNILYGLESIFLIRKISFLDAPGFSYVLEDQYEELLLSENELSKDSRILTALIRNLRTQFLYRLGEEITFSIYQTRSGAMIPLVLSTKNEKIGFRILRDGHISLSDQRSADSFLRKYPNGRIIFLDLNSKKPIIKDSRVMCCHPIHLIF